MFSTKRTMRNDSLNQTTGRSLTATERNGSQRVECHNGRHESRLQSNGANNRKEPNDELHSDSRRAGDNGRIL